MTLNDLLHDDYEEEQEEEKAQSPARKRPRDDEHEGQRTRQRVPEPEPEQGNTVQDAERMGRIAAAMARPPDPDEEEVEPPAVVVPMVEIDWSNYVEREPIEESKAKFCFWCVIAQSTQQYRDSKHIAKLVRFWEENKAYMAPFEFCRKMQKLYNTLARPRMVNSKNERFTGPPWPAKQMWEHDLLHMLRPTGQREMVARTLGYVLHNMTQNGLFKKDSKGNMQYDSRVLKDYRDTWKELRSLLDKLESTRNTELYGLQ